MNWTLDKFLITFLVLILVRVVHCFSWFSGIEMVTEGVLLTCCLSTRFFTPSMTNWEPVFITLENSLWGGGEIDEEKPGREERQDGGKQEAEGRRTGLGW